TPFDNDKIDYQSLGVIIDEQIAAGIKTIVVGGTTAEAATLKDYEREELYYFVKEYIGGRTKLIFGTGTNETVEVLSRGALAERIGCDGVLIVTPYYNKGTERGVVKHYERIAKSTDLPIIVYNVPSRTGVNLTFGQLDELAKIDNIVGIKEATDSLVRFVRIAAYGEDLTLYSGNDSSTYTALSLGGGGVISVLSNLLPKEMSELCEKYFSKDFAGALNIQLSLLPLMEAMFIDTNPAPLKYAMSRAGLLENELRLPLSPITAESERKIDRLLANYLI
ncbi:MAG: 4-hydroxy-tetrahydrodipicolinate synthase, partial [Clostridia bacterium]|nr:4-hydroxy-tetrahydrodipicolinate synthase [Clostridia bacterium]